MTDQTERPAPRRRTGLAVACATLALGAGALGAAATGAFADDGGTTGSSSGGAATTYVQAQGRPRRPRRPPATARARAARRGAAGRGPRRRRADRGRGGRAPRAPATVYLCAVAGPDAQRARAEPGHPRAPAAARARAGGRRSTPSSTWSGCRPRCRSTPTSRSGRGSSGFRPEALAELVERRRGRADRSSCAPRSTCVSADDCLTLRPLDAAGARRRAARATPSSRPRLAGVDLAPVLAPRAAILAERPLAGPELRAALAARFPDLDARRARVRVPRPAARSCRCRRAACGARPAR